MNNRKRSLQDVHQTQDFEHSTNAAENAPTLEAVLHTNFEELARQLPQFGAVWRSHSRLQAPEVRCALAQALLSVHWGICTASVPVLHLAPPIPNRYFFVRWLLETVLPLTPTEGVVSQRQCGLDIGTGAYCVYPLLLVASSPSVDMYATDIDTDSLRYAQQHVCRNPRFASRVKLLQVQPSHRQSSSSPIGDIDAAPTSGPLRCSLEAIDRKQQLTFCMTNPPFYDVEESRSNVSEMTFNEGHYPGGEAGFCIDMIMDGLVLYLQHAGDSSAVQPPVWSSTMCGKKSSWTFLRNVLWQLLGYSHVCATDFAPKHLMRWFLAWTFQPGVVAVGQSVSWQFSVGSISNVEMEQRIQTYCSCFPGGSLQCKQVGNELEITERRNSTIGWKGDASLPPNVRTLVAQHPTARNALLPTEGHFLLRLRVVDGYVQANANVYSPNGRAVTEKIRSQLQGEVCRTSRQWRRKLKYVGQT